MDWQFYPVFRIDAEDGIIPNIRLPDNCEDLIRRFYSQDRRKTVEYYAGKLQKIMGYDISLAWGNRGLAHISIGVHGGLDLEDDAVPWRFQVHNLGGLNSLVGAAIATKYVSELLKSSS